MTPSGKPASAVALWLGDIFPPKDRNQPARSGVGSGYRPLTLPGLKVLMLIAERCREPTLTQYLDSVWI